VVGDHRLHRLAIGQRRELGVADRRAEFHRLDSNLDEDFQEAGEVAGLDHRAVRIGLAADRQAEWRGGGHWHARRRVGRGPHTGTRFDEGAS
jgi:hypothetical protein